MKQTPLRLVLVPLFKVNHPDDVVVEATVMFTGCDEVDAPSPSVATARRLWLPAGALSQVMRKGNPNAVPRGVAPRKKSTRVIDPSASDTFASMRIELPAPKVAPGVGVMIETAGGWFVGPGCPPPPPPPP